MQQDLRENPAKKRSFLTGAAVLAAAGIFGKVIAAFYKVWLNALIGSEGLGIYQIPSNYYYFLLIISSAGLPTAISKLVSERVAAGDTRGAHEVFAVARTVLLVTGTLSSVLMAALAKPLAAGAGQPEAALGFLMLSPSLLIVCMLSAYRGYFQGWQKMSPTAVSQVIEQIGRLAFGFGLAVLWAPKGAAWSAAGAVLGVTASELCATAFIFGGYRAATRRNRKHPVRVTRERLRRLSPQIFRIAIPVTLGASIMPLVGLTDTMTVINRLTQTGVTVAEATSMYGIFNGMVQSIINMPAVISVAFSTSLVPAISDALARGRGKSAARSAHQGLKLASLVGLPCAAGIYLLADPIMALLSPGYSPAEHELSVRLLGLMAFALVFLTMTQTTNGILQGYGKPQLPVVALGAGAAAKVAINWFLLVTDWGISGAAVGSVCCYAIAALVNMINVRRLTRRRVNLVRVFILPLFSAGAMAGVVWLLRRALLGRVSGNVMLAVCVAAGVAVYAAMVLLTGAIRRSDMELLPGGARLARLLGRLHLLRG